MDASKRLEQVEKRLLSTYIRVLDFVLVHVLGTRGVLSNVLLFSELIDKDLAAVPSVSLGEAILCGRHLGGERQLSDGGMCILGVQSLGQCCQVYSFKMQSQS